MKNLGVTGFFYLNMTHIYSGEKDKYSALVTGERTHIGRLLQLTNTIGRRSNK